MTEVLDVLISPHRATSRYLVPLAVLIPQVRSSELAYDSSLVASLHRLLNVESGIFVY